MVLGCLCDVWQFHGLTCHKTDIMLVQGGLSIFETNRVKTGQKSTIQLVEIKYVFFKTQLPPSLSKNARTVGCRLSELEVTQFKVPINALIIFSVHLWSFNLYVMEKTQSTVGPIFVLPWNFFGVCPRWSDTVASSVLLVWNTPQADDGLISAWWSEYDGLLVSGGPDFVQSSDWRVLTLKPRHTPFL